MGKRRTARVKKDLEEDSEEHQTEMEEDDTEEDAEMEKAEENSEEQGNESEGTTEKEVKVNYKNGSMNDETSGDREAGVFMKKTFRLSTENAARILHEALQGSIDKALIAESPPATPKSGEVYIIDIAKIGDRKEALQDGYYWRHDGNKKYMKSFPVKNYTSEPKSQRENIDMTIIKSIYKIKDSRAPRGFSNVFQRHTFYAVELDRYFVMHYFGNEKDVRPESFRDVLTARTPRTPSSARKDSNRRRILTTCFNCQNAPEDVANKTVTHLRLSRRLLDKKGECIRPDLTIMEAIEEVMEGALTKIMLKKFTNNFMCHDCTNVLRKAIIRRTEAEDSLKQLHDRIDQVTNDERRKYYRENYATDKSGRCWGCMVEFSKSDDKKKEKYGRHCLEMSLISGMTVMEGIETMLEDEADSLFGLSPKRLFICKICFQLMKSVVKAQCSFDNLQAHFTGRTHPQGLMAELQGIVADSDDEMPYIIPPLIDNSDLDDYDEEVEYDECEDEEEEEATGEENKRSTDESVTDSPAAKKQKMDGSEAGGQGEPEVTVMEEGEGKDGGKKISIRLTAIKSKGDQANSPVKIQEVKKEDLAKPDAVNETLTPDTWQLMYDRGSVGKAGLVRLVMEMAGVAYVNVEEDRGPESSPFPSFPIIKKGSLVISHPVVICKHIGEENGLGPSLIQDKVRAEQITQYCNEFLGEGGFAQHGNWLTKDDKPSEKGREVYIERFNERLPLWLAFFEEMLKQNFGGKGYLVGNNLTYADLALYHALQTTIYRFPSKYVQLDLEVLKGYSRRIGGLTSIKAYHKSQNYKGVTSYSF